MKLTVGLKGNRENAERVINTPANPLYEVFIGAPPAISGNGRTGITPTTRKTLEHVKALCDQRGTRMNVLLNSITLQPTAELEAFVREAEDIGADSFTVANDNVLTYLLDRRENKGSAYGIKLSTFMYITTPEQTTRYTKRLRQQDTIIINQNENRNFPTLKKIVETATVPLELFANTLCLNNCKDNIRNHAIFMSEYSNKGIVQDPYLNNCVARRVSDPSLIIAAPIIRPEDVSIYESTGIDIFKLGTRSFTTEQTISIIDAYQKRSFDGDLAELNGTVNVGVNAHHPLNNKILDGMVPAIAAGRDKDIIYQSYLEKMQGETHGKHRTT